jgi:AcrR family transcriptional regulator
MPARAHKNQPIQARAHATRELLLETAAELLGEVGVERLSSNLICAQAGVTPPAFYRYFKDKYAVLEELGFRLMEAQNEAVLPLLAHDITESDLRGLILESISITKRFSGGPWVLRILRAVPALQHVRLESHRRVSALIAKTAMKRKRNKSARIALQARVLVDLGYAAIELAFDEPALSETALAKNAARAMYALAQEMQN